MIESKILLGMVAFIFYFIVITVHEWGHWIMMRKLGLKPTFKFNWWGVEVGGNCYGKMRIQEYKKTLWCGIISGFVILMFLPMQSVLGLSFTSAIMIYAIGCGIDISNLLQLSSLSKKWNNKTVIQASEYIIEKMKRGMG